MFLSVTRVVTWSNKSTLPSHRQNLSDLSSGSPMTNSASGTKICGIIGCVISKGTFNSFTRQLKPEMDRGHSDSLASSQHPELEDDRGPASDRLAADGYHCRCILIAGIRHDLKQVKSGRGNLIDGRVYSVCIPGGEPPNTGLKSAEPALQGER